MHCARLIFVFLMILACSPRAIHAAKEADIPWKTNKPIVDVRRELYRKQEHSDYPIWARMYTTGPGLERWEIVSDESSGSDIWVNIRGRVSRDNGRTWSPFEKLTDNIQKYQGVTVWEGDDLSQPLYDPDAGVLVQTWLRQIQPTPTSNLNFTYYRLSRDYGRTWSEPRQLKYEEGPDFDPKDPMNAQFISKNRAYLPPNLVQCKDGSLVLSVTDIADENGERTGRRGEGMGSMCFNGRWNASQEDYEWTAGTPVAIPRKLSSRGLQEANIAELNDGRLLVVWRASNADMKSQEEKSAAGHKWFSISSDGGKTLGPVQEWKYDDASPFFSPSSFHRLIRHQKSGKLYWIGNICPDPPTGNHPRYPLVIGEVDEDKAAIKKHTVTAIADRGNKDSEKFQLSNFSLLENPENHSLEMLVVDYDSDAAGKERRGDCYKYTMTFRQ